MTDPHPPTEDKNGLESDPFLKGLNRFGSSPDRQELRLALDSHADVGDVAAAVAGVDLPEHYRRYLEEYEELPALFRTLLELIASSDRRFSVEVADMVPIVLVEVHSVDVHMTVKARPDL